MGRGLSNLEKAILIVGYANGRITSEVWDRLRDTGQKNTKQFYLEEIYRRYWGSTQWGDKSVSASISRAVSRLAKRGFLERTFDALTCRKDWAITESGRELGKRLTVNEAKHD